MNCILPPLKDSVFRTHQHWNIYFELKSGHSNFLSVSGIYSMGGAPVMSKIHIKRIVGENWPIFCSYSTNYYMAKHNNSHTIVTLDNREKKNPKLNTIFLENSLFLLPSRNATTFCSILAWLKDKQKRAGANNFNYSKRFFRARFEFFNFLILIEQELGKVRLH